MESRVFEEIAREILESGVDAQKAKARVCKKYSLAQVPSNADILGNVSAEKRILLIPYLKKKPIRTLSGVAVVAVMTSPAQCPHGLCQYCPTGENSPQSYTGYEPAALRGKRSDFDPYTQVTDRLEQLYAIGHNVEKSELIVMGGTFPARDYGYQEMFVKRCFDAMNSFNREHKIEASGIDEAQKINETAGVRNVGVTIETRPDFAREEHLDVMLRLGTTRIEMGVQTLRDDVYQRVQRGHAVADVVSSTRMVKDAGLKLGYHMMPGLFSGAAQDLEMFKRLFSDPDFRPDMLKIYPTLVLEGTGLYDLWKAKEFEPLTDEQAVDLIVKVKKILPKWVRTMRIQRDIPSGLIAAGVKKGNLAELVQERLDEDGVRCRCIRCRDVGHLNYKKGVRASKFEILVEKYEASFAHEFFISAEDEGKDAIAAYLRMRFPSSKAHRTEIDSNAAVIRELKVLGQALNLGEKKSGAKQHYGIGRNLLEHAEEIAKSEGKERILVTSAVGTREYYRKFGYERLGPYMWKVL